MKTSLLVTLFFAMVLGISAAAYKPAFDSVTCDTMDCSGDVYFNFTNLNPSYSYEVSVTELGGLGETDAGEIVPNPDGTGSFSFGATPADNYEVVLSEIHTNGNVAHNPAVDEVVAVP